MREERPGVDRIARRGEPSDAELVAVVDEELQLDETRQPRRDRVRQGQRRHQRRMGDDAVLDAHDRMRGAAAIADRDRGPAAATSHRETHAVPGSPLRPGDRRQHASRCRARMSPELPQHHLLTELELCGMGEVLPRTTPAGADHPAGRLSAMRRGTGWIEELEDVRASVVAALLDDFRCDALSRQALVEKDDAAVRGARHRFGAVGQPLDVELHHASARSGAV